MKFLKIIQLAFRQLIINRSKSIFAIAGLSVGVASVIVMYGVGEGAKKEALAQIEEMGTNLITINPGKAKNVMLRRDSTDKITTLRRKDCEVILNNCKNVKIAVPSMAGMIKVKYGNSVTLSMVNGVTVPYFGMKNLKLEKGDLFTEKEDELSQRVAVLGGLISRTLFEEEDPVGKTLLIGKVPFTIVGVLKSKGITADGANLDAQVLIPINTAQRRVFNVDYLNRIFIEVVERSKMEEAEKEIISVLREYHKLELRGKENDFTIDNQVTDIKASESSARSFTFLIAGVSAIALLVGGIGIFAVMLLSVKERNIEIGLRLAVGAKRKDIVMQFITESGILGLAGGFTGLLTGILISVIAKYIFNWQIAFSYIPITVAISFSIAVGLVFGVIPAGKASQADPITALQKE